jgi:PTH2 family peptidyl-tRNA hydrolase
MSDIKMVIVCRTDLNMRKGKLASQVAHAAMKFIVDNDESPRDDELTVVLSTDEAEWLFSGSFTKIVVGCDSEDALHDLIFQANLADIEVHSIVDSGKTEFNGEPTLTCAAFGPCKSEEIDKITGSLKLL